MRASASATPPNAPRANPVVPIIGGSVDKSREVMTLVGSVDS